MQTLHLQRIETRVKRNHPVNRQSDDGIRRPIQQVTKCPENFPILAAFLIKLFPPAKLINDQRKTTDVYILPRHTAQLFQSFLSLSFFHFSNYTQTEHREKWMERAEINE
jgi:hypothetical protein